MKKLEKYLLVMLECYQNWRTWLLQMKMGMVLDDNSLGSSVKAVDKISLGGLGFVATLTDMEKKNQQLKPPSSSATSGSKLKCLLV